MPVDLDVEEDASIPRTAFRSPHFANVMVLIVQMPSRMMDIMLTMIMMMSDKQ